MKKTNTKHEQIVCAAKKTSIGGQALIEGIMMRGPKISAMAVRNPQGEMVVEEWETYSKPIPKVCKLPIIRGVYGFISSITMGYKALMRSAEIAGLDEIEEEMAREKAAKKAAKRKGKEKTQTSEAEAVQKAPDKENDKKSSALITIVMLIASILGVALAIGLFIMLPTFLYELLPFPTLENKALNSLMKSAFEGIFKTVMLVGYMALVSLMKDIKRTFQYHGAEHKTIFCYESGEELTVENVRNQRRFHPRCGTAFLILMLIVGMFISFLIDPIFYLTIGALPHVAIRALIKLLTLPITMGIGYELIKLAGRRDNLFTRIISAPGLWLQRITVLEPTDDMIECAITAFKKVIPQDQSDNY